MTTCPHCSEPLATGQEYCLVCGARVGAPSRLGGASSTGWALRALIAASVAAIGAAGAIAATGGENGTPEVVTAIGGFARAPESSEETPVGRSGVAEWPTDEEGWTIALATVPQTRGRAAALARARAARRKGLPQVGVLDSSRYASLHSGYWIVFSGVYSSEAEATSALEEARRSSRAAVVRHVVP
jgi:hypothetical protein